MNRTTESIVGTHWGHYRITVIDGTIAGVKPVSTDSNPSPIGESLMDAMNPDCRIMNPVVRESYLRGDSDHQERRGKEEFITVSWDEALDLAAEAINRVILEHGNSAIFGGSYGWSSAGRFHHAQSQLHRFLNILGGYTASVDTYSAAAAEAITPYILGADEYTMADNMVSYGDIAAHTDLLVAFGGLCLHNNQVVSGGVGDHKDRQALEKVVDAGVDIVNISPLNSDIPDFMTAEWLQARPNTDTAIMLALAYTLEVKGYVDRDFIEHYTTGYERFRPYLLGETDGIPKNIPWAASICGLSEEKLHCLAEKLIKSRRPLITVALSLQRTEHGEQPFWMATVLASMLGQIGLKGGGLGLSWGNNGRGFYNRLRVPFAWGHLEQGRNPIDTWIPVARITDMLLNPSQSYTYRGQNREYPEIKLIYWAGGNPFHHHQDLNRLREAWKKPQTVIVNEHAWTATARHADIIFPATMALERNDIACGLDLYITPSKQVINPFGDARSDYDILTGLSERLGVETTFTENRDEMSWLRKIYADCRDNARSANIELPEFDEFWEGEGICLEGRVKPRNFIIEKFREDPKRNRLETPSGKIEIYSETIASYHYPDCPGYPCWMEKKEWLGGKLAGKFPLHLISNQPRNKLHSQLDFGRWSLKDKTAGRETVLMNPKDAAMRGLRDGGIVQIFNDRGACLAGMKVTENIMPGVIRLPTGAWFDPDNSGGLERHGNPNVLTQDVGTSSLAQGPTAHSCLVEVEAFEGEPPPMISFKLPAIRSKLD